MADGKEIPQQDTTVKEFLQLGEIRAATDNDFDYFMRLAEYHEDWVKKLDKNGVLVWQKETDHSTIKMAKEFHWFGSETSMTCAVTGFDLYRPTTIAEKLQVRSEFQGVSAGVAFDTIMDGEYRKTWDENMIEDFEICRLNNFNDIGYYSMKCPIPLKNRDFVNQRSWKIFSEDQFIVFNHSVQHHEIPPKKNFIRALSYVTGFLIKSSAGGCELIYVTQSDPRGKLPKWIINMLMNKIAPAIFKRLFIAATKYEDWKAMNNPEYKPWRRPEQNLIPLVDSALLKLKLDDLSTCQPIVNGDEDEEMPTEEGVEEYIEHLVQSLEHTKTGNEQL